MSDVVWGAVLVVCATAIVCTLIIGIFFGRTH